MTKKRIYRKRTAPIDLPCRKTIYHSREEAEDMIKYINETRVTKEIRAYKCEICGFWHLTSKID
ncbi:MAG TPA: hypothetical protein VJ963_06930 [Bacteroidales bacterium]|nr:hypothetical protein [Bacteroidales bacterium]